MILLLATCSKGTNPRLFDYAYHEPSRVWNVNAPKEACKFSSTFSFQLYAETKILPKHRTQSSQNNTNNQTRKHFIWVDFELNKITSNMLNPSHLIYQTKEIRNTACCPKGSTEILYLGVC